MLYKLKALKSQEWRLVEESGLHRTEELETEAALPRTVSRHGVEMLSPSPPTCRTEAAPVPKLGHGISVYCNETFRYAPQPCQEGGWSAFNHCPKERWEEEKEAGWEDPISLC